MADDPRLWPRCLRHLYWVCQAPSLIRHELVFDLTAALPEDWMQRMTTLSRCGGACTGTGAGCYPASRGLL